MQLIEDTGIFNLCHKGFKYFALNSRVDIKYCMTLNRLNECIVDHEFDMRRNVINENLNQQQKMCIARKSTF